MKIFPLCVVDTLVQAEQIQSILNDFNFNVGASVVPFEDKYLVEIAQRDTDTPYSLETLEVIANLAKAVDKALVALDIHFYTSI